LIGNLPRFLHGGSAFIADRRSSQSIDLDGSAQSGSICRDTSARSAIRQLSYSQKELEMNWDIVEGNWKQFKGKVKARWGKLTDDHLDVIGGKRVQLSGKIQEAYGVTKDEAEKQIKSFEDRNKDYRPKS
jgi:uncharacterized protein YjbJ (UPF0337 family)